MGASADQACIADRVVRCPEGTGRHQAGAQGQQTRNAVQLRRLEGVLQRHRREYGGEAASQHRLP